MIKRLLTSTLFFMLFALNIYATSSNNTYISTSKTSYYDDEYITVTMHNMSGESDDWLGIFYKNADNTVENILDWSWGEGQKNGQITFDPQKAGDYEVRAFFHNSLNQEAVAHFSVKQKSNTQTPHISLEKNQFNVDESIQVSANGLNGGYNNWIGIFAKNAPDNYDNLLADYYFDGSSSQTTFEPLWQTGEYEARLFANDTINSIAKISFNVGDNTPEQNNARVFSQKESYQTGESIHINAKDLSTQTSNNWIGIFRASSSSTWDNVILENWFATQKNVNITFTNNLEPGLYEARLFYNDTVSPVIAKTTFRIERNPQPNNETLYEDAEHGLQGWRQISGTIAPEIVSQGYESAHCVKLTPEWNEAGTTNAAEYRLPLNNNKGENILEMDVGGAGPSGGRAAGKFSNAPRGSMPHFFIGVIVDTKQGQRSIIWDSYLNHIGAQPTRSDYGNGFIELSFPSPIEHVRGFGFAPIDQWDHFRVDIQDALSQLEPGNEITSVRDLSVSGGFLDNIKLSK